MDSSENTPLCTSTKYIKEGLKCTIVEQHLPKPFTKFDGLWCIILKLLTEKEDCATSQVAVSITVITHASWC